MSGETFELTPGGLTISDSRRLSEAGTKIALDAGGRTAIEAALSVVSQVIGLARPASKLSALRHMIRYTSCNTSSASSRSPKIRRQIPNSFADVRS